MNLRSATRDRNHETRRSEAQPLWTTYSKGCGRRRGEGVQDRFVTTDLDTLATALYVRTDDLLKESPHRAPWRPAAGIGPQVSDAELVTLAVMQALLGFTSEARWLRHARAHLRGMFPHVPQQPGYNKRLRALAAAMTWLTAVLARDTSLWSDDVWIADSTPWNAAAPAKPPAALTWPDGPNTGTAPATRATSGDCGCTCSPPCTACPSASRSRVPRLMNARSSWASSTTPRSPPAGPGSHHRG